MKLKKKYEIKFDKYQTDFKTLDSILFIYKNKVIFSSEADIRDSKKRDYSDGDFLISQCILIFDLDTKSVIYSVFLYYKYSLEILDNILYLHSNLFEKSTDATLNLDTLEYKTLDKSTKKETTEYSKNFYNPDNIYFPTKDKKEIVEIHIDFINIIDYKTKNILRNFDNKISHYLEKYKYKPLENICGCVGKDKKYLAIATLSNANKSEYELNEIFPYYGDEDPRSPIGYNRDLIMLMDFETLKPVKFFGRDFKYTWDLSYRMLWASIKNIEITENNRYVVAGNISENDSSILIFDILEPHNKGIIPYYTLESLFVTKGENEILCILENEKRTEILLTCFEIISETEEEVKKRNDNRELFCIT